ncbi:hypothetical protein [Niveibacterium terrae]|uniref:hypothetical protein n=1 Tax=Niveibacterium terrae TaxID=3373598 RepID=UPI003A8FF0B0
MLGAASSNVWSAPADEFKETAIATPEDVAPLLEACLSDTSSEAAGKFASLFPLEYESKKDLLPDWVQAMGSYMDFSGYAMRSLRYFAYDKMRMLVDEHRGEFLKIKLQLAALYDPQAFSGITRIVKTREETERIRSQMDKALAQPVVVRVTEISDARSSVVFGTGEAKRVTLGISLADKKKRAVLKEEMVVQRVEGKWRAIVIY